MIQHLIDWVVEHPSYEPGTMRHAVLCRSEFVKRLGGWYPAVAAYRAAWKDRFGSNLDGIENEELDQRLPPDMLAYLRDCAAHGVAARQPPCSTRIRGLPDPSLVDHLDEAFRKVWKDAHRGRALLVAELPDALMRGVRASPLGRVPKMNPDRTLAPEGRIIHAQGVNASGSKYHHPPALQPTHRGVARLALWWSARHPKVPLLIAKLDVEGAFKWIWLRPEDVGLFAADLPEEELGFVSFTPGEYSIFGQAWKGLRRQHGSPAPEVHDEVPYFAKLLMDDKVLLEPLLGTRPWLSMRAAEHCARQLLGPDCINQEKKTEEGDFAVEQIVWGLTLSTEVLTCRLPPPKVERLQVLAGDASCDTGCRELKILHVQRLRGMLTFAVVTRPQLLPELGAMDRMLRTADPGRRLVCPVGSPAQVDRIWAEWWEVVETLRVYTSEPASWEALFTAGLVQVLSPRARLAYPGVAESLLWTGGDSTLSKLGCIEYEAQL